MNTKIETVNSAFKGCRKVERKKCPVCGSSDTTKFLNADRYGVEVHYRACQDCELVYQSPVPPPDFYEWFYSGFYRGILEELFQRSFSNEALIPGQIKYANEVAKFLLPELAALPNKKLKVLDIGGSTGVVAIELNRILSEIGYELDIVVQDPSSEELLYAAANGCKTACGLFENLSFDEFGQFDLILLCQTIDHLYSLETTFSKISDLMHSGTLFFVDYVDFKFNCNAKGFKESVKIDHIFNFSETNFEILLKTNDYRICDKAISSDYHLRKFLLKKGEDKDLKLKFKDKFTSWITSK